MSKITVNGDHLSDNEDEVVVVAEENLIFQDENHSSQLLNSLNMMRKNRTFCDVILHVSRKKTIIVIFCKIVNCLYRVRQWYEKKSQRKISRYIKPEALKN